MTPTRLVSAIYPEYYPFDKLPFINNCVNVYDPSQLQKGDILLVWGGEDISPMLYNESLNVYGDGSPVPSRRDSIEWELMKEATELDIPIIGVCRGAQMLCALMGGSLWQDVSNHGGRHIVETYDGQRLDTNSMHHQMLRLDNIPKTAYDLIAWTQPRSRVYHHGQNSVHWKTDTDIDPEFVYFKNIKGFAVQWHPEFEEYPDEATDYVLNFINSKLEITEHA